MLRKILKKFFYCFSLIKIYIFLLTNKRLKNKKSCLMISSGMDLTGAPLMLLESCKIYQQKGYNVVVLCNQYGCLSKEFKKLGISVFTLSITNDKVFNKLLQINFDFIIVNTIILYEYINKLNKYKIPTIWWLHEGYSIITQFKNKLPKKLNNNIKVLTVSDLVGNDLKEAGIKYSYDNLCYGIPDLFNNVNAKEKRDGINILIIGTICERKNQMMAIEAYDRLSDDIKDRVKLFFVGGKLSKDGYYLKFKRAINNFNNIKHIRKINRNKIINLYNNMHAVLCCSIEDPLPVVVTEGLMMQVPVIVSSGTGHYSLIEHNVNGYKFNLENPEKLVKIITDLCNNYDDFMKVSVNGRKLFDNKFTLEKFEERLMLFTTDVLEKKNGLK